MECGEIILPQYPDVVEQWANDVQNTIDHCEEEVGATIDKAKTDIQTTIDQCTDTVDAAVSKAKDDVQATIDILLNARDAGELNGATFTPSVTDDGDLSWTNDRNFANPQPVNIHGATFTPSISEDGTLRWTNDKGLPNPESVNIRGAAGINAVVVSDTEPATGPVLWFDTSKVE
jgi:hypothetical protein